MILQAKFFAYFAFFVKKVWSLNRASIIKQKYKVISVHVSFYFTMFPSPTQNLSDQTHGFLLVETFKEFPLKSLSPQIGHFKDFKGILSPVASSPLSQL